MFDRFYILKTNKLSNTLIISSNNNIEILSLIVRKLAHFSIYTVVGLSMMGFMCTFNIRNIIKFIISLVIGITYAVSDEVHQYFIPGRNASVIDVCIKLFCCIYITFFRISVLNSAEEKNLFAKMCC